MRVVLRLRPGRLLPAVALLLVLLATACGGPPQPGAGASEAILAPAAPASSASSASSPGAPSPDLPGPLPTVVVLSSIPGPAGPASTVASTATCPAGALLVGGGASALLKGGARPPSSLHLNGTFPVVASGGQAPHAWTTVGATGGQLVIGAVTSNLALCARVTATATATALQVVQASVPGPGKAATVTRATATCPAGTTLLGGGGATQAPGSSPSLHLLGTFPSGPDGAPATSGSPMSWSAQADSGGRGGTGTKTIAYAVCATGLPIGATQAVARTVAGPTQGTTARTATATCPSGTSLLSGGVRTGLHSGKPPQQGIHLTGSFPSDAAGTMVTTSGSATSWTGRAETGGQSAPNTETTGFALCATSPP